MENLIKSLIITIFMAGNVFAQIPALKDGELIVVDSILSPSATLEAAEMEPLMLNIVRLDLLESSADPQDIKYEWKVSADGEDIPFLVGLGGNYIGFTFRTASTITIEAIVHATYEVKDVSYQDIGNDTFKKIISYVDINRDFAVRKDYKVGDDPDPPTPILSDVAQFVRDECVKAMKDYPKVKSYKSCATLASVFRDAVKRIKGGELKTFEQTGNYLFQQNNNAVVANGMTAEQWDPFWSLFNDYIFDKHSKGELKDMNAYADFLEESAKGFASASELLK